MNKIHTVKISKATIEDFEQVYPLLLEFNNPIITKNLWKNLFADHWNFQKGFVGYKLVSGGRIVGFIAYILSKRWQGVREENFCVLSSVIVKKEFRGYGMDLIYPLLDLKDHTIISFTPTRGTFQILTELFHFKILDTHEVIIPCLITPPAVFNRNPELILAQEKIRQHLTPEERKLYEDHNQFNCKHMCIKFQKEHLYIVAKKRYLRHIPFQKIYYLNRPDLFMKNLSYLRFHLPRVLRSSGLIIDSRFVGEKNIPLSFQREFYMPFAYKSSRLLPNQIDYLYSEYFLLEG